MLHHEITMHQPRTVAVYGNSLFIAGIEASLKTQPELQVMRIAGDDSDMAEPLTEACPDVIVFDLSATRPLISFSFLVEHPQVLFIGLDLASDRGFVFSGQYSQVSTTDNLLQLILQVQAGTGEGLPAAMSTEGIQDLVKLQGERQETPDGK